MNDPPQVLCVPAGMVPEVTMPSPSIAARRVPLHLGVAGRLIMEYNYGISTSIRWDTAPVTILQQLNKPFISIYYIVELHPRAVMFVGL